METGPAARVRRGEPGGMWVGRDRRYRTARSASSFIDSKDCRWS